MSIDHDKTVARVKAELTHFSNQQLADLYNMVVPRMQDVGFRISHNLEFSDPERIATKPGEAPRTAE